MDSGVNGRQRGDVGSETTSLGWVLLDGGPPAARRGGPWNGGEPLLDNYSYYSLENVDFWLESNRIR